MLATTNDEIGERVLTKKGFQRSSPGEPKSMLKKRTARFEKSVGVRVDQKKPAAVHKRRESEILGGGLRFGGKKEPSSAAVFTKSKEENLIKKGGMARGGDPPEKILKDKLEVQNTKKF